jgi:hypothetical protein
LCRFEFGTQHQQPGVSCQCQQPPYSFRKRHHTTRCCFFCFCFFKPNALPAVPRPLGLQQRCAGGNNNKPMGLQQLIVCSCRHCHRHWAMSPIGSVSSLDARCLPAAVVALHWPMRPEGSC